MRAHPRLRPRVLSSGINCPPCADTTNVSGFNCHTCADTTDVDEGIYDAALDSESTQPAAAMESFRRMMDLILSELHVQDTRQHGKTSACCSVWATRVCPVVPHRRRQSVPSCTHAPACATFCAQHACLLCSPCAWTVVSTPLGKHMFACMLARQFTCLLARQFTYLAPWPQPLIDAEKANSG